ncbi:MAG TPA: hypothetical protein VJY34_23950 [Roseiarcus sp.]|nr:hypothetical protein [Roseiarcus sp.]
MIINGNFVNPLAIKLPHTREFDGKMLAAFKRERDRIDQLMAQAPAIAATASEPAASLPGSAKTTEPARGYSAGGSADREDDRLERGERRTRSRAM